MFTLPRASRRLAAHCVLATLLLFGALALLPGAPRGVAAAPATATWQLQSPLPTRYALNAIDLVSASEGWAVGEQGTILHTTDSGLTWAAQTVPGGATVYAVTFVDALHGIAGSNNTVLYTTNGGATWTAGTGVTGSIYEVALADATHGF